MKFYFAPMEGLTGHVYRSAHEVFFPHVDRYFTPFIATTQHGKLTSRELNDILPENNQGITLIPQILSSAAKDFILTSKVIREFGYTEVNLNLGCPSGTVVAKGKGAGFLMRKKALDEFLDEIFSASVTNISVKTRLGMEQPEEFYDLIEIFNRYPISELIIHPRVREEYYKNKPHLDIFKEILLLSKNPVCYNGDIFTVLDYEKFTEAFPEVKTIMLGRGLLAKPGMLDEIIENKKTEKEGLKAFHDRVYEGYQAILSGDRNVLFKMKELWFYMLASLEDNEKYAKKIKKAERLSVYEDIIAEMFKTCDIIKCSER